jgi:hypothetical protein
MKRLISLFFFSAVIITTLDAQKTSGYTYSFDNGVKVKMEQCWNQVWVSQTFEALKPADQANPLSVNARTLGNLTSGSSFKLFSAGKEVKLQGVKPGTYTLKQTFKLAGNPGTISFEISDVVIKPQTKTILSIVLYDYQFIFEEKPGKNNGMASFSSKIERYKGNIESNPTCGIVAVYEKGKHDQPSGPAGGASRTGSVKPGTYDILITLGAPGRPQKIWLENFTMKPDVSYNLTTNLNAGVIEYAGAEKEVKSFHLYPGGTSARQTGNPAPDKNLEIMKCESQATTTTSCPPGTYDVLLNYSNGKKYEWRKNIAVTTGSRTQVK